MSKIVIDKVEESRHPEGGINVYYNGQENYLHMTEKYEGNPDVRKAVKKFLKTKTNKILTVGELDEQASQIAQDRQKASDALRVETVNKELAELSGGQIKDVSEIPDAKAFILVERANRHREKMSKK